MSLPSIITSTLDVLFMEEPQRTELQGWYPVDASDYIQCYTYVFDTCSNKDQQLPQSGNSTTRATESTPEDLYVGLIEYLNEICQHIAQTILPLEDKEELSRLLSIAYTRYRWALKFTSHLFSYMDRYFVPQCCKDGIGWLRMDEEERMRFFNEAGLFDEDKWEAKVISVLMSKWSLLNPNSSGEIREATLRAEIASDWESEKRIVSVVGSGLRSWRKYVSDPQRDALSPKAVTPGMSFMFFCTGLSFRFRETSASVCYRPP
jgi:hypothetical protein